MAANETEFLKTREIFFQDPHPDPEQSATAQEIFQGLDAITEINLLKGNGIRICYDVRKICLEDLEATLIELGFHLYSSLLMKMKRALYYFTEETQRANLGIGAGQANQTREVFVNRYVRTKHGCRDQRPGHWRKYL